MKIHLSKSILAGLMALLVATPLAAATDADKYSEGHAVCGFGTCKVDVYQNAWSYASWGDCTYASGVLVSCLVSHSCTAYFEGVLGSGQLYCFDSSGGYSSNTCTLVTACQTSAGTSTTVVKGTCATFDAMATVVSTTGTATAYATTIRICVNANGPY